MERPKQINNPTGGWKQCPKCLGKWQGRRKGHRCSDPEGSVYVIKADALAGVYKIRKSENPQRRLADLRTASPTPLSLHSSWCVRSYSFLEIQLHKRYADQRLHGEWFQLTDEHLQDLSAFVTLYLQSALLP